MTFSPPDSGQLRRQMALQRNAGIQDATGHTQDDWQDVAPNVWVRATSRPRFVWQVTTNTWVATQQWDIAMRYRPGVIVGMRLLDKATNHAYKIARVDDVLLRQTWLALTCEEIGTP